MNPQLLQILRLCQLSSPALPVGAFNFSQGLEYAVQTGSVDDEASAFEWLQGLATHSQATLDLPVLLRLHRAWSENEVAQVRRWSCYLIASRETAESRAEDRHSGQALAKVLIELGIDASRAWIGNADASWAALFALACAHWQIDRTLCASGYLWAWAENQVLAAVKLVPLGQSAYVRMLGRFTAAIPQLVESAQRVADHEIGISTPLHGMASAAHETQYSRLFRS